jgi:hypothetical protein
MADNVDKFGIEIDLDVSGLQAELIKSQNELRKFQTQLKSSTDTTEIAKLTSSITFLDEKIAHLGTRMGDVKKPSSDATNALTNLSRVAQDAPYGFMGIANNLNPMLESFQRLSKETGSAGGALKAMLAGLTGPAGIGVALGVVSSLIVAFGDDINNFFTKLSEGSGDSIRFRDAFKEIGNEFTSAVKKVNDVEIAFSEYHKGILTGEQALKIYNDQLGKNLGVKSNINEAEKVFKDKTSAYIEAQLQRSLADVASKKAAEELLKVKQLEATGGEKTGALTKFAVGNLVPYLSGGLTDKLIGQYDKAKVKSDIAESEDIIKSYKKIAEDAKSLSDQLSKNSGINLDPEKTKVSKTIKNSLGQRDNTINESIALLENDTKATAKWADEQMKIHDKMLNFYKKYGDVIKAETGVSRIKDIITDQDKRREKDEEKNPFSEKKISTKGTSVEREENRIKKFDKELEASKKTLEGYAEFISGTLTEGIMTMWDAMQAGDSPLQALGDYLGDVAKKFAFAIIQATIFNGVMMLLNALTGGAAGEFMGAISSTSKLLGMAEGGIVSRPTLAMVGEGGQSEAVMPLNKLGNMMNSTFAAGAMSGMGGGGNGQFVLKGNDLVLALQRSNYSLNLRRGNGI